MRPAPFANSLRHSAVRVARIGCTQTTGQFGMMVFRTREASKNADATGTTPANLAARYARRQVAGRDAYAWQRGVNQPITRWPSGDGPCESTKTRRRRPEAGRHYPCGDAFRSLYGLVRGRTGLVSSPPIYGNSQVNPRPASRRAAAGPERPASAHSRGTKCRCRGPARTRGSPEGRRRRA